MARSTQSLFVGRMCASATARQTAAPPGLTPSSRNAAWSGSQRTCRRGTRRRRSPRPAAAAGRVHRVRPRRAGGGIAAPYTPAPAVVSPRHTTKLDPSIALTDRTVYSRSGGNAVAAAAPAAVASAAGRGRGRSRRRARRPRGRTPSAAAAAARTRRSRRRSVRRRRGSMHPGKGRRSEAGPCSRRS